MMLIETDPDCALSEWLLPLQRARPSFAPSLTPLNDQRRLCLILAFLSRGSKRRA